MSTYLVKSLNLVASVALLTACDFIAPINMDLPNHLPEAPRAAAAAVTNPQAGEQVALSKRRSQPLSSLPEREWRVLTPELTEKLKLPQQPVTINIDAMPLNEFIHLALGEILGLTFEVDASIATRTDPVTIHVTEALKARALLDMVEQALRTLDVFLAWSPEGLRVLPISKATSSVPQVLSENAKMLLKLGRSMTVIPLHYASPQEALAFVRHFMDTGQVGDVSANMRLNALVVIGMPDRIAAYRQAIELVDRPSFANKKLTLIRPVYWQADLLAKVLTEFLQAQSVPVSKAGAEYGVHLLVVKPINAIVVVSPEQSWTNMVDNWLETLDTAEAAGEENNTYVYFVKHGNARGLGQALGGVLGEKNTESDKPDTSQSPMQSGQLSGGLTNSGNDNGELGMSTASAPTSKTDNSRKDSVDVVEGKGLRVIVDNERNALIFVGSSRAYRAAYNLLQQLDRVPRQILIEATVADISLSKTKELGVEWEYQHDNGIGTLGTLGGLGLAAATGGLSYAYIDKLAGITAKISALIKDGSAKVLSSPRLQAKDNEEASIQVGTEVPVISSEISNTASGISPTGTNLLRGYRYISTGVILKFTPTILEGGQVELKISQEVSEAGNSTTSTPPIFKRQVETVLVADSGQTVMIGGLITHNEGLDIQKVPILGDIPLLGQLFRTESRSDRVTEMVVLITPHVITSSADAAYLTDAFQKQLHWETVK
ncbi:MAG: secretin N-terminal domain-containing protein [Methylococcales bacterium]